MGRYYKTAKPEFLDYMSKLPEQYMLMATQQATQDIQQNEAAMYDLYGKLQVNALPNDRQDADKRLAYYEDQINAISQQLQSDPLAFRRKAPQITNLARTLHKDMTRGELAAIQGNYDKDVEWQKTYQDLIRGGKISDPQSVNALRAYNLGNFGKTAFDQTTGNYNTYNPDELLPGVNLTTHIDEVVAKMKPQIINQSHASFMTDKAGEPQFIVEQGGETKVLTEAEIANAAYNEILSNRDVLSSLKQRSDIGTQTGVFNGDEFITPFNYEKVDDEKYELKWNPESTVAKAMQAAIEIYKVNDITKSYKRIKNVSGRGAGTKDEYNGYVVDVGNGKITTSAIPTDVSQYMANSPTGINDASIAQIQNDIRTSAIEGLKVAANPLIETVADAIDQSGADAGLLVQLQNVFDGVMSVDDLDTFVKNFDEVLTNIEKETKTEILSTPRIESALNAIDSRVRDANNIKNQYDIYKQVAIWTGTTTDKLYSDKKGNDVTVDLIETDGDYYQGTDANVFAGTAKKIAEKYEDTSRLPDVFSYTVEEKDADGNPTGHVFVNEITRDAFNKKFGFTGTAGSASTLDDVNWGTGTTKAGKSTKDEKGSITKAKITGVSRIIDDVPTKSLTEGEGSKVLQSPFKLYVESPKGNVTILIEDKISSAELRDLDKNYAAKYDYDKKIRDIQKMIYPASQALTGRNMTANEMSTFGVPAFDLLDGVEYQPPLIGGDKRGILTFTYQDGTSKKIPDDDVRALEEYFKFYYNK